jgi:hypothetical protein
MKIEVECKISIFRYISVREQDFILKSRLGPRIESVKTRFKAHDEEEGDAVAIETPQHEDLESWHWTLLFMRKPSLAIMIGWFKCLLGIHD